LIQEVLEWKITYRKLMLPSSTALLPARRFSYPYPRLSVCQPGEVSGFQPRVTTQAWLFIP
jgi:hypothetical protein